MNEDKLSMDQAKPSYWAVLPAAVRYDAKITAGAKLLYAEITSLADVRGYCWATNSYFQDLYGISEPTVQRYLRALKEAGYIRIEDGSGGSAVRRIYAGVNPMRTNPVKNDGVPPSKMTGGGVKNDGGPPSKMTGSTINKKNNQEKEQPPKAPQGAGADYVPKKTTDWKPERFDAFWKFYPLHTNKQRAISAWDRLKPSDELLAVIGRALKRQKAEKAARGEEWKLHAATYLNNARWTDEESPTGSAGAPFRQGGQPRPEGAEEAIEWV